VSSQNSKSFVVVIFEFDMKNGLDNLVVQICQGDLGGSKFSHASTPWENTSYISSVFHRNDVVDACAQTSFETSNQRPILTFHTCNAELDPNDFTFEWIPNINLSDNNGQSTEAFPDESIVYTAIVTDNISGCSDSVTVSVFVDCGSCLRPSATIQNPTCIGDMDGQINAVANISDSPVTLYIVDLALNDTLLFGSLGTHNEIFNGIGDGTYSILIVDTIGFD